MPQLLAGAKSFAAQMRREDRLLDKICHPTTWLNQGRWEDEIETPEREDVTSGMTPEERERWRRKIEELKKGDDND